jgi:hypothetical protein
VAPIAKLQAAIVHSSMHVAPCHPNISVSTIERPIETSAATRVRKPVIKNSPVISYTARDFVRTGFVLTIIALGLVMLLGATYWRWLGYV